MSFSPRKYFANRVGGNIWDGKSRNISRAASKEEPGDVLSRSIGRTTIIKEVCFALHGAVDKIKLLSPRECSFFFFTGGSPNWGIKTCVIASSSSSFSWHQTAKKNLHDGISTAPLYFILWLVADANLIDFGSESLTYPKQCNWLGLCDDRLKRNSQTGKNCQVLVSPESSGQALWTWVLSCVDYDPRDYTQTLSYFLCNRFALISLPRHCT